MTNQSDINTLKLKIQNELIQSGQYDEISKFLKFKLIENGWFDNFKNLASNTISEKENPNFSSLIRDLEPKALEMVPDNVKEETLVKIRQFLDSVIDK
ncbi:hypothetical protein PACTADRAFT_73290 [Pachysolen tannophilus NRRL Y-2460]|uniref:Transcription and mRNA export factor SUS1 n=1 Tax=Pachysolen tannophilus NRRL Y-2460 TaxID=669874 RepID=A0A1E4U0Q1_PACTA|nr:hypothetical protein PACTADRAFT_73290 [Pachysolen tannophilus NRRL Y-2460]